MSSNPIEQLLPFQVHQSELIAGLANKAVTYSNELVAGNISKDEYIELLEGLKRTDLISKQANEMLAIEALKEILAVLINLAIKG